ncbi:hypothetical protein ACGF4C_07205 [Streptomyces sp. NPDC048197]
MRTGQGWPAHEVCPVELGSPPLAPALARALALAAARTRRDHA